MKQGLIIDVFGDKRWYKDDLYHREDGPAIEVCEGYKSWYINGKRHREDGHAVEYTDGHKEWWLNGKRYTERDYNEWLLVRNFNTI